jgi:hypothetical protein
MRMSSSSVSLAAIGRLRIIDLGCSVTGCGLRLTPIGRVPAIETDRLTWIGLGSIGRLARPGVAAVLRLRALRGVRATTSEGSFSGALGSSLALAAGLAAGLGLAFASGLAVVLVSCVDRIALAGSGAGTGSDAIGLGLSAGDGVELIGRYRNWSGMGIESPIGKPRLTQQAIERSAIHYRFLGSFFLSPVRGVPWESCHSPICPADSPRCSPPHEAPMDSRRTSAKTLRSPRGAYLKIG